MRDKIIFDLIEQESNRQDNDIQLIASENYVSEQVMEAQGSILTNKYAEGYPGKRYYGGCEVIDEIEVIAQERFKKLFKTDYHVNVQPHSGSQANQGVFNCILNPGDKVLGMSLDHGGHLTHGHALSLTGKLYEISSYVTDENGELNYDEIRKIAIDVKPKLIICGASAFSLEIDFEKFSLIAKEVGAYLLADIAHIAGLVATGNHMSPFAHVDFVTTTTHKTLRGPRGGVIACKEEHAKLLDRSVFPGIQGGPLEHVIGAKAVAFYEALSDDFKVYQDQVVANCKAFCNQFIELGYTIISGRTENHLFLIDVLQSVGVTGKDAENILGKHNITVNKNSIPNDTLSPVISSGIRLGTAAMTTKGYNESDFILLANKIDQILKENK